VDPVRAGRKPGDAYADGDILTRRAKLHRPNRLARAIPNLGPGKPPRITMTAGNHKNAQNAGSA
jgi:hypothetical protein